MDPKQDEVLEALRQLAERLGKLEAAVAALAGGALVLAREAKATQALIAISQVKEELS